MASAIFHENNNAVLSHDGWVKVANATITQQILLISTDHILVKGRENSYKAYIHKNLKSMMTFCNVGDTALIKFHQGKAWVVGYKKGGF